MINIKPIKSVVKKPEKKKPKSNPVGRPTKWNKDIIKKAGNYIESCVDSYIKGIGVEVKLPTVEGLSLYLNISRETLYQWAKIYPEFSDTLSEIEKKQKERLISSGLSGVYNSTIAKLLLSVNHKMNDKGEDDSLKTIADLMAENIKGRQPKPKDETNH